MEENRSLSWTDLFIKVILIVIFVLFTVWLLSLSNKGVTNSLDVLTNNVFAENIDIFSTSHVFFLYLDYNINYYI